MRVRTVSSVALLSLLPLCLCAQETAAPKPAAPKAAAENAAAQPAKPAPEPGLYAVIATSHGLIMAKLFDAEAPKTVKNIADLAMGRKPWTDPRTRTRVTRPLYNGLTFHRVIPGFMIQGGDPMGTGMGGTDAIPDEFHPTLMFDRPGRLGMANAGPGTGSSQFFITEVPTPHLDGRHTIFGQVVEGMEVVERIARVPRNSEDRPLAPVRILKMSVRRVGPAADPAKAKPAPAKAKITSPAAKPKPATPKPSAPKPATPKPAVPAK